MRIYFKKYFKGPSNPEYELKKYKNERLFRQREGILEENGSFAGGSAEQKRRMTNNNLEAMDRDYEENIQMSKMINLVGMIAFVVVLLLFNIVFWVTALSEQTTPGKDFLKVVTDRY